jgi:DNA polymerase I-like protein with 3'-5' exonuclease and polymerase domains
MREYEYYKENVKFRMTVHDSIMLEMKDNVKIEAIVNQMCADTVAHFNLPVDLHVDVDTGDYWQ